MLKKRIFAELACSAMKNVEERSGRVRGELEGREGEERCEEEEDAPSY
jgi:hypothetical protein